MICEPIHYNAGCIPPEPGFLELLRSATQRARHRPDLRRGALRVPHHPRRRAGPVRRHAGPDDARQGAGQRVAALLRLRPGRPDAQARPDRPGRPQRHLLRASAQRAGRARHARGAEPARRLRPRSTPRPTASTATCRPSSTATGCRRGCRAGAPASASTSASPTRSHLDRRARPRPRAEPRLRAACFERGVYFHGYTRQGPPGHAGFSLAHTDADLDESLNVFDAVAANLAAGRV